MSGWKYQKVRRWRFYPTWMPWGWKVTSYYVSGGDFVYSREEHEHELAVHPIR